MIRKEIIISLWLATTTALANDKPQFVETKEQIIRHLSPVRFKGASTTEHDVRAKGFRSVKDSDPRAAVHIRFRHDSTEIDGNQQIALNNLCDVLEGQLNRVALTIVGHTDSTGPEEYNNKLSRRRANSVRQYLIECGIQAPRLLAIGKGENKPRVSNATAEGRAENRRVEFVNVGRY